MEEFIRNLLRNNFTAKTIKSRGLKKGWEIKDEDIEKIKNELNEEFKVNEKTKETASNSSKKEIVRLFTEQDNFFDYTKKLGVDTEYKDGNELLMAVQKISADIFLRHSICLARALDLQTEGVNVDLDILWKGYDVAFKGLNKAWGDYKFKQSVSRTKLSITQENND